MSALLKPILVVDDGPDERQLTLEAFRRNHVPNPVIVTRNGTEALNYLLPESKIGDPPPLPVFVLLDLNLPAMNGVEVLRKLRAHPRTCVLPVVIFTTSHDSTDIFDSYRSGANSYVRKPIEFGQFCGLVGSLAHYWLALNESSPLPASDSGC